MSERYDAKVSALVARLDDCTCATGADCGDDCHCDELIDHIYQLVDHEMPEADEHRLIRHAANCTGCQQSIKMEYIMRSVVKRGCMENAPESLRMKVTKIVRSQGV